MSNDCLDYQQIFLGLPVAAIVARDRIMLNCNTAALELFRANRDNILRQPFSILYPDQTEFEEAGRRMEPFLSGRVIHHDSRIMRRLDGSHFWVTVSGHAFNRDIPHEMTAWTFSEFSGDWDSKRSAINLTRREREIAALLVDQLTSKQIARALDISPKTVDIHRASLLRKYSVASTAELMTILRS